MKGTTEFRVAGEWYKRLGTSALWYTGCSLAVMVIIAIVFSVITLVNPEAAADTLVTVSVETDIIFQGDTLAAVSFYYLEATVIFMLIIGIVLPLVFFEPYIAMGVTRKQLGRGMFLAVFLLSLSIVVVYGLLYLINALTGSMDITLIGGFANILIKLVFLIIYFLMGWGIAIGFLFRNPITATLGIAWSILFIYGVEKLMGYFNAGANMTAEALSQFKGAGAAAIPALIMAVVILKLTEKIPLKG